MSNESYKDSFRKPQELLNFARLSSNDRCLDVATGYGYLAKQISKTTTQPVDVVNGSERRGFFESVGIQKEITAMEKNGKIRHHWSPLAQPGLGKTNEYDLVTMQNTYHDLYDMPVDRRVFLASIRQAMKPTGRFLLIDHKAAKSRGAKDAGANRGLHRIELSVVVEELEACGFVIVAQSDMFAFAGDNLRRSAWTDPMKNTDRFVLLCEKAGE
jgi:predicted methyltransferase